MTSDTPLISVTLPTKNGLPQIAGTIEGLRRQTYGNFELIVQDACSTDGTLEYLRGLDTPFPIEIVSEPDESLVDGYARAWRRCRGDLVASAACDEVYEPDAFQLYVDWHRQHPDAVFIYSGSRLVDAEGRVISEFRPKPFQLLDYLRHDMCPTTAGAFKRELMGAEYRLDESLSYVPDFELFIRLALRFGEQNLVAKERITMSARADASSLSYSPRFFRRFADAKSGIMEKLLTGPWKEEFTDYLRRDFTTRMHVSFARLIDSIEGPGDSYAHHVLAAGAQASDRQMIEGLALASPHLHWDGEVGEARLRAEPIPPAPGPSDGAWTMPLDQSETPSPAAEVTRPGGAVAVQIPAGDFQYALTLPMQLPALSFETSAAWIRVRYRDARGQPTVSLYNRELNAISGETPIEEGASGEVLLQLRDRRFTRLLVRGSGLAATLTVDAVELVSPELRGERPLEARLDRRRPLSDADCALLTQVIGGMASGDPAPGWKRLAAEIAEIAACGRPIRADFGLADEAAPAVARAADRALRQALARPATAPERIGLGARGPTRLCSGVDWQDDGMAATTRRLFGEAGLDIEKQSSWLWERVATALAVGKTGNVLLVASEPDSLAPLLAHLGLSLTVATPDEINSGVARREAWQAVFDGSWLKTTAPWRTWDDSKATFDAVVLLAPCLTPADPADLDALLRAVAPHVRPGAMLVATAGVELTGPALDGAISLNDWLGLYDAAGPLGARGFQPQGAVDTRIPADALVRFAPFGAGETPVPALSAGDDGATLMPMIAAACWPETLQPGPARPRERSRPAQRPLSQTPPMWGAGDSLWARPEDLDDQGREEQVSAEPQMHAPRGWLRRILGGG